MVTSSYPLHAGDGTAPFIEEIARSVAARGHHVDIVLPHHPALRRNAEERIRFFAFPYAPHPALNVWGYAQSMNADRGFKWKTLATAPFAAFATRRAVRARLAAEPYDVVHAHWVVPGAVLARSAARRARRPLVISLHGSDMFAAERNALVGRAARRAFSDSMSVTACSSDLRARAVRLGASPERTSVLPYGVDTAFFGSSRLSDGARETMRRRLGAVANDHTLVLAVGRLVEKKGFEYLVRATAATPDIRVAIVGDGDLETEIRSLAQESKSLVTLAGRFSREEIRDALHCADIVAVPSVVDSKGNVDGLPNTLLEAMAAGKAIVASRVAGIPDVVENEVHGLLVPQRDSVSLHAAIVRLKGDRSLRERLASSAKTHAASDLTWSRVATTLESIYVETQTLAQR